MQKRTETSKEYDYTVSPGAIAQAPLRPRDAARLLVYDRTTGEVIDDVFRNLAKYLPPKSVVVLNRTKVIPARLWCHRLTGGRVQVLYLRHDARYWYALLNRPLAVGEQLQGKGFTLRVVANHDGVWTLKPSFPCASSHALLLRQGTTPIPPYIKHTPLSERALRTEYQTVFARTQGSVAAPTASLHFTPRLLAALKRAGHSIQYVTLHVGMGTFASLTDVQLASGKLHSEEYAIDARTARALQVAKRAGRPIIAVGTTVARTLESAADARGILQKCNGATQLFIHSPYRWRFVNHLITNFHVPKSSLMMLVASLVGRERLLALYHRALGMGYRFFSFGDGMLIR